MTPTPTTPLQASFIVTPIPSTAPAPSETFNRTHDLLYFQLVHIYFPFFSYLIAEVREMFSIKAQNWKYKKEKIHPSIPGKKYHVHRKSQEESADIL